MSKEQHDINNALTFLGVGLSSIVRVLPELTEAHRLANGAGLLKQAKIHEGQLSLLTEIANDLLPQVEKIQAIVDGVFKP